MSPKDAVSLGKKKMTKDNNDKGDLEAIFLHFGSLFGPSIEMTITPLLEMGLMKRWG